MRRVRLAMIIMLNDLASLPTKLNNVLISDERTGDYRKVVKLIIRSFKVNEENSPALLSLCQVDLVFIDSIYNAGMSCVWRPSFGRIYFDPSQI